PLKIGLMTGIYAVFMNIFGALGSGLSVPISSIGNLGWRGALAIWGVLTVIALLIWLPQLRKSHKVTSEATEVETKEKIISCVHHLLGELRYLWVDNR